MSKHVRHLIGAYYENQLRAQQVEAFNRHISTCVTCRLHLAHHELMVKDLRHVLQKTPAPNSLNINSVWRHLRSTRFKARISLSVVLPALLSVVLLFSSVASHAVFGPAAPTGPVLLANHPVYSTQDEFPGAPPQASETPYKPEAEQLITPATSITAALTPIPVPGNMADR